MKANANDIRSVASHSHHLDPLTRTISLPKTTQDALAHYRGHSGLALRANAVFRCGHPSRASPADIELLREKVGRLMPFFVAMKIIRVSLHGLPRACISACAAFVPCVYACTHECRQLPHSRGIRTVIDFREAKEKKPNTFRSEVRCLHVAVMLS